jgi:hypothetical protein
MGLLSSVATSTGRTRGRKNMFPINIEKLGEMMGPASPRAFTHQEYQDLAGACPLGRRDQPGADLFHECVIAQLHGARSPLKMVRRTISPRCTGRGSPLHKPQLSRL